MAQIPYAVSNGQLGVEVHLHHAADVFLVNEHNFRNYQAGRKFEYYGGHYTKTPVNIRVNGIGRYYLIVRGGGRYNYRFY